MNRDNVRQVGAKENDDDNKRICLPSKETQLLHQKPDVLAQPSSRQFG